MRKIWAILVACLVCAGMVRAAPRFFCEAPEYDFGTRYSSETVEHSFAIRNKGDARLDILLVRSCCGMTASVNKRTVEPGGELLCHVTIPLKGRGGTLSRQFYLHTNDPENAVVPLRVFGKVVSGIMPEGQTSAPVRAHAGAADAGAPPPASPVERRKQPVRLRSALSDPKAAALRFEPDEMDVGSVSVGKQTTRTAILTAVDSSVHVLHAHARNMYLTAAIMPDRDPGNYTLAVIMAASMPAGMFDERVVVTYRDTQVRKTEYRVFGKRVEPGAEAVEAPMKDAPVATDAEEGRIEGTHSEPEAAALEASYSEPHVAQKSRRPVIEYFYEPGCPECETVERESLADLARRWPDAYELRRLNTGVLTNYLRLVDYQERLGGGMNVPVALVVNGQRMLGGLKAIRAGFIPAVEQALVDADSEEALTEAPSLVDDFDEDRALERLRERGRSFTVWVVAGAGLADGINPCAMSALVFFMSLLAVFKVKGRVLLLTGIAFCMASFVTYTAIGFGLQRALYALHGFPQWRLRVERFMMGALVVFAFLSFRDAWRFAKEGKAGNLSLHLPDTMQRRIRAIMRSGLGTGMPVIAAFGIGTAVTLLESVCTGQLYVPTLALMAREGAGQGRMLMLLLLYNVMFILPLIGVFALTLCGLRSETLVAWSRKNVPFSKVLLGLFFAGMAVLLWVLP